MERQSMKLILTLLATINMVTIDTHSKDYEPFIIETDTKIYKIEEDYSITEQFKTIDLMNE